MNVVSFSRYAMDLNFSGYSSFLDKHDMLLPIVGRGSWFTEFRSVFSENVTSQKINSFTNSSSVFSAADYAASSRGPLFTARW